VDGKRIKPGWIIASVCWIGISVALMFLLRNNVLESFDKDAADQWQDWRDHVEQEQRESAPVERRVPSSELPPSYVLMQDHFAVCLVAAVVFSFLLFAVFSFLVTGVLSDSTVIQYEQDDGDGTDRKDTEPVEEVRRNPEGEAQSGGS
jgi:hypothetical protein